MVASDAVILDPALLALKGSQFREYVRIRSALQTEDETPEEKLEADARALEEATNDVTQAEKDAPLTPLNPAKTSPTRKSPSTLKTPASLTKASSQ